MIFSIVHSKSKFFLIISISLLFSSCIKESNINQPIIKPRLVLNTFLTPENTINLYLSTTKSIEDSIFPVVKNASIKILENGKELEVLNNGNQLGLYKSKIKPRSKNNYEIIVLAPEYSEKLTVKETIPERVLIDSAICTYGEFVEPGDGGSSLYSMSVYFNDPLGEKNYYEIQVFDEDNINKRKYIEAISEATDPALIAEGDQDFHPTSFFFSDKVFNGTHYRFNVRYWGVHSTKTSQIFVLFRSISENYYKYRKFWTRHNFNQNDTEFLEDPFDIFFKSEPLTMYTNVQNGYGIAAGYQEEIYLAKLIRFKDKN